MSTARSDERELIKGSQLKLNSLTSRITFFCCSQHCNTCCVVKLTRLLQTSRHHSANVWATFLVSPPPEPVVLSVALYLQHWKQSKQLANWKITYYKSWPQTWPEESELETFSDSSVCPYVLLTPVPKWSRNSSSWWRSPNTATAMCILMSYSRC